MKESGVSWRKPRRETCHKSHETAESLPVSGGRGRGPKNSAVLYDWKEEPFCWDFLVERGSTRGDKLPVVSNFSNLLYSRERELHFKNERSPLLGWCTSCRACWPLAAKDTLSVLRNRNENTVA